MTDRIDPHAPYTAILAQSLPDSGRASAYVCYALRGHPGNTAPQHPGIGDTPRQAAQNACYWVAEAAWVRVVPISKAPAWAIEDAEQARRAGWSEDEAGRVWVCP